MENRKILSFFKRKKMIDSSRVAICIPCYNEAQTIAKVIADYRAVFPLAKIFVFDNNSTDDSAALAKAAGAKVVAEPRQGKGNVIRTIFRTIHADCLILTDGDDTYPAEDALKLARAVLEDGADMAIGDRLSSTYFTENKRLFHNSGNRLVRALINHLFHNNVADIMTGLRAFSPVFARAFPVLSQGFEIETEMTIHAVDKNFKIAEIPIAYRDRPMGSVSKLNTFTDGFLVVKTIALLFKDYKPLIFFGALALLALLLSLILGVPVLAEYLQTGIVPRFPTLIVASGLFVVSLLLASVGIILEVILRQHRQNYELWLNLFERFKQ